MIAANDLQIGLTRKDVILSLDTAVIACKAGLRTGVKDRHKKFTLSSCSYLTDDFNLKIKAAVSQQSQDWKAPQIKDLKLIITQYYTFMTSDNFFIACLVHPITPLKRLHIWSLLELLAHTKHSLLQHLPRNYYYYTGNI